MSRMKNDVPKARLVSVAKSKGKRVPGGWKGKVWIAEDFDDPLPDDILDAFEGRRLRRAGDVGLKVRRPGR